jgi:hypothetical protein
MFLQKNLNILKKKFNVKSIETNNDQDAKRRQDIIILDDRSIPKKVKPQDIVINNEDNYEDLVNIQSEDDDELII